MCIISMAHGACEVHVSLVAAMGWLRLVDSLKLWVSFAKEPYKRDDILQKRPVILWSLLIVATPSIIGIVTVVGLVCSTVACIFILQVFYIYYPRGTQCYCTFIIIFSLLLALLPLLFMLLSLLSLLLLPLSLLPLSFILLSLSSLLL